METSASSGSPLIILNPAANRGNMAEHRAIVRSRAEREHAEYVETTQRGEAKELARCAAEEGRPIIVVGGDGSVHEAVNGILSSQRRVPLGIVAAGSGNDYAWNTLKLPHDPTAAIERRYVLVAVTNGPTYGAGFRINPTADHTDGLFDVCTISYAPLVRALRLLPVVQKGEHAGLPEVTFYRARSIHIESRHLVNIQMDGETTCTTSYDARNLSGALWVRV